MEKGKEVLKDLLESGEITVLDRKIAQGVRAAHCVTNPGEMTALFHAGFDDGFFSSQPHDSFVVAHNPFLG